MIRRLSFVVFVFLFLTLVSGASSFSGSSSGFSSHNVYQSPAGINFPYTTEQMKTYWPALVDSETCKAREDFLLMVAPGACQPAVVRSDLLAEQNVPVFCQISALLINPLIDVEKIKNVRFSGSYPAEVAGVGFHPSRVAIKSRDSQLGSPYIENIGYVVIVLKKQEIEKNLPDFVNVTLSAQIEYQSGNAFGIGRASFKLPLVSDNEKASERNKQTFWNGRLAPQLDGVDMEKATISLYQGDRKLTTVRAEKGKDSPEFYIPGSYCQAGITFNYDGLEAAQTTAYLEIIGRDGSRDSLQVYEGSRLLDNYCRVSKITFDRTNSNTANAPKVEIVCGAQRLNLALAPKDATPNPNAVFVKGDLVKIKTTDEVKALIVYEVSEVIFDATKPNVPAKYRLVVRSTKSSDGLEGEGYTAGQLIKINGVLIDEVSEKYDDAIKKVKEEYEAIANDYPAEDVPVETGVSKAGEVALIRAIDFVRDVSVKGNVLKKQTEFNLLTLFLTNYPDSSLADVFRADIDRIYSDDKFSSGVIKYKSGDYIFRLISVTEPSKKASASFSVGSQSVTANMGDPVSIVAGAKHSIQLVKIVDANSVDVQFYCTNNNDETPFTVRFQIGDSAKKLCAKERGDEGVFVRLNSIDAELLASVRLEPIVKGTQSKVNVTVGIGIEKRAIKLGTDSTKERIKNLNESINKFSQISERLGKSVTALKAACLATAAGLTVKNFVFGASGKSLARKQAMEGPEGWKAKCSSAISTGNLDGKSVQYKTMTQCFNGEADKINAEVEKRTQAIQETNARVKEVESSPGITEGSALSGKTVNSEEAAKLYCKKLVDKYTAERVFVGWGKDVNCESKILPLSYSDLRELDYNLALDGVSGQSEALEGVYLRAQQNQQTINQISGNSANVEGLFTTTAGDDKKDVSLRFYPVKDNKVIISDTITVPNVDSIEGSNPHAVLVSANVKSSPSSGTPETKRYLILGERVGDTLYPKKAYEVNVQNAEIKVKSPVSLDQVKNEAKIAKITQGITQGKINRDDQKVIYFSSGPDKDLAAQVPFDIQGGWYVRVKSELKIGSGTPAYDKSALPKVWEICNVGQDGRIDLYDSCQRVDEGISTSAPVLGLDLVTSRRLIERSRSALMTANAKAKNARTVTIDGQPLEVGMGSVPTESTQCQDFFSPQECKLLFNVCDPVICPTSRCNFGGSYYVPDVIQSGVVGSALLCLPNIKDEVYIPVCLSGIKAGIDGYVSVLKGHRDCLQEQLDTGRTVGFCDQVYSVYMCELFWRQAAPLADLAIPKLFEIITQGGTAPRGGGEYLTAVEAWDRAKGSADYFTQEYAVNTLKAFNIRSAGELGSEFCKSFISTKYPTKIDSLLEADSPPQFHAWFSSVPFTDVTAPATSQYKVYYHIYAGENFGSSYSVYLKNPPQDSFYNYPASISVATGFVGQGQYQSETKDFTAPEGYKELCVSIDGTEQCGFGQVSTSFALNSIRDGVIADKLQTSDIKNSRECVSGGAGYVNFNPSALLVNTNPQAALEETLAPNDAKRGIVRVCSARNPGLSTNPARWQDVGKCDGEMRCWLDSDSVEKSIGIANEGLKEEVTNNLQKQQEQVFVEQGVILASDDIVVNIREFRKQVDSATKDTASEIRKNIDNVFGSDLEKVLYVHHKAQIALLKAKLTEKMNVVEVKSASVVSAKTDISAVEVKPVTPTSNTPVVDESVTSSIDSTEDNAKEDQPLSIPFQQIVSVIGSSSPISDIYINSNDIPIISGVFFKVVIFHNCDTVKLSLVPITTPPSESVSPYPIIYDTPLYSQKSVSLSPYEVYTEFSIKIDSAGQFEVIPYCNEKPLNEAKLRFIVNHKSVP